MGDISEHFSRHEFACGCGCGFAAVDVELLGVLEDIREHFNTPVKVSSGCRCAEFNTLIGSKATSYHIKGMAADIMVEGIPASMVADRLEHIYPAKYGIGRYLTGWTHIDMRARRVRWNSR